LRASLLFVELYQFVQIFVGDEKVECGKLAVYEEYIVAAHPLSDKFAGYLSHDVALARPALTTEHLYHTVTTITHDVCGIHGAFIAYLYGISVPKIILADGNYPFVHTLFFCKNTKKIRV
jgi:hypothetical protein